MTEEDIGGRHLQAKESQGLLTTTRRYDEPRKESPLEPLRERDSDDTLILNFWPPERCKSKFLLFEAMEVVVICYHSKRKLTQGGVSFISAARRQAPWLG